MIRLVLAALIALATALPAMAVQPDEVLDDPVLEARARAISRRKSAAWSARTKASMRATPTWRAICVFWCVSVWWPATPTGKCSISGCSLWRFRSAAPAGQQRNAAALVRTGLVLLIAGTVIVLRTRNGPQADCRPQA
jgi:hypothetical protein